MKKLGLNKKVGQATTKFSSQSASDMKNVMKRLSKTRLSETEQFFYGFIQRIGIFLEKKDLNSAITHANKMVSEMKEAVLLD